MTATTIAPAGDAPAGTPRDDVRATAEALRAQGTTYALLARLFAREVDDGLLTSMQAASYPGDTGNAHLDAGYRGLCRYLSSTWERTRSDLAVDYFHTFIGNTQDTDRVAFPYESVYTSPEHLLMQDARDEVLAAYRAASVVIDEGQNPTNDPEDHIGFELSFAGLLGNRAADVLEAGDDAAAADLLATKRAFLQDHLLNWAPRFAADVQRIAQTGFYQALADVLMGVLEVDAALLDDVLVDSAPAEGAQLEGAPTEDVLPDGASAITN